MKWFEPIIAIVALLLVIGPIISHFVKKKNGTLKCECGHYRNECVGNCTACDEASKLVSKYHNSHKDNDKYVYVLDVKGMKCGMCEEHINNSLRNAFNGTSIKVKSQRKKDSVTISSKTVLDMKKIMDIITSLGYIVEGMRLK